jgi:hypothetical protein
MKTKVQKLISRAMEDVRGLDQKYPNEEDAKQLASILNSILDHTTREVLLVTGHECWKYKGEVCTDNCEGLCKNSC